MKPPDLSALAGNWRWSRAHAAGLRDLVNSLYWTYSAGLPKRKNGVILQLRYPPPVGDLKLRVRTNRSDRFIFGEVFDHLYYRLDSSPPPKTVLDIGANAGFTAIFFARSFPGAEIACVEPEPGNLSVMEENLRLNDVRAAIFAAAVSVRDGTEVLSLHEKDYGHALEQASTWPGRKLTVTAMTVPSILDRLGWEKVGLLKIDIEGYEKQLFAQECNWLRRVDRMFIEWHEGEEESHAALTRVARSYGFSAPRRLPGIWLLARD